MECFMRNDTIFGARIIITNLIIDDTSHFQFRFFFSPLTLSLDFVAKIVNGKKNSQFSILCVSYIA